MTNVESSLWLRRAAAQGYAPAFVRVGDDYRDGRGGTVKNPAQAIGWRRRGAAARDCDAEAALAAMLFVGEGVAADPIQGYAWALIYQWDDRGNSKYWVAESLRADLARAMTPVQIAQSERLAVTWRPDVIVEPQRERFR